MRSALVQARGLWQLSVRIPSTVSRRMLSNGPSSLEQNVVRSYRWSPAAFALCAGGGAVAALSLCDEDRIDRWNDRWATGNVSWHRSQPNALLVDHKDRFLDRNAPNKPSGAANNHRVLVPLCGKTVDMTFLSDQGHEVVGVEAAETAAWQLQRDAWLKFETSQQPAAAAGNERRPGFIPAPTFDKKRSGYVFTTDDKGTGYYLDTNAIKWFRDRKRRLSVVIHDFLHLTSGDIGTFDRIWDRAALVAIRPEDREEYVATCDSLLEPGGSILLVTLVYDQDKMKGPPFSIPLAEVQRLYGGKLGYKVETLSYFDARKDYQGQKWEELQKAGLDEVAFLVTKPTATGPGWLSRLLRR